MLLMQVLNHFGYILQCASGCTHHRAGRRNISLGRYSSLLAFACLYSNVHFRDTTSNVTQLLTCSVTELFTCFFHEFSVKGVDWNVHHNIQIYYNHFIHFIYRFNHGLFFSLQISLPIQETVLISSHSESLRCREKGHPWPNDHK